MKYLIALSLFMSALPTFAEEAEHVLTVAEYDAWVAEEKAKGTWVEPKAPTEVAPERSNTALRFIGVALQGIGQGLQQQNSVNCVTQKIGDQFYTNCR